MGPITKEVNEKELMRIFGEENVHREDLDVGEGFYESGMVVSIDEEHSLDIFFGQHEKFKALVSVILKGSKWKTIKGIGLGTTLEELREINGGEFEFSGFAWDYSGTIIDWNGGALEEDHRVGKQIILRLCGKGRYELSREEEEQVIGEQVLMSNLAVLSKMELSVCSLKILLE